jgi:membrane protein HdeD
MQRTGMAIIFIILGLIVIAFPLLGVIPLSILTGLVVLFLGIGLLISGVMEMGESAGLGILELILGIIALVLGVGFIINPGWFSFLAGLIVFIVGIFLIVSGLATVFSKTVEEHRFNGFVAIIIGLIYLIVGSLVANPVILGILIGLWLLVMGILMFLQKE